MKRQTKDGSWHEFSSDEEAQRALLIDCGAPLDEVNDYIMCDRTQAAAIAQRARGKGYDLRNGG